MIAENIYVPHSDVKMQGCWLAKLSKVLKLGSFGIFLVKRTDLSRCFAA
jgi:hypothetical protein